MEDRLEEIIQNGIWGKKRMKNTKKSKRRGIQKVYYVLKWISRRKGEKEQGRCHVWSDNGWEFPNSSNRWMIFQFRDNEKVLQTPSMINKNKSTLRYLKIKPVKIKDKKKILKVGRKDYLQLSSVTQSCPTLWDPMDCSMPGLPDHHQLPEFTQTYVL